MQECVGSRGAEFTDHMDVARGCASLEARGIVLIAKRTATGGQKRTQCKRAEQQLAVSQWTVAWILAMRSINIGVIDREV